MKMVMAIVDRAETARVLEALIVAGYTATFTDSRGGVLRQARQTLFIGVEEDASVPEVLSIIRENCRSSVSLDSTGHDIAFQTVPQRTWAEVGNAAVFVWDIEQFQIY